MHLRFAREIRHTLVIVFVKRTHVGRNVKIKSSVRCLTRAFIAAVEKLILPLSTTNYRQRSSARKREYRLTHQLPARRTTSGGNPSVRSSTTQEHRTTYVGFSTVATRPTTAWFTTHWHPPRGKTTELVRHQKCRCRRRTFHGC